ncbi:MAG: MBG domain-containing protein, partial [Acidimicrobiales bacterium]
PTAALTVTPAPLTVTADNASRYHEAANPKFTVTYSGFVLGQNLASSGVRGTPSCTTTATTASDVGTYPITCDAGTLSAMNYRFAFVPGSLTVEPAPTSLSAQPALLGLSPLTASLFTLSATLTSQVTRTGLAGQTLVFSAGSTTLCTAQTNASGTATCPLLSASVVPQVLATIESDGYRVTYAATKDFQSAHASAPLLGTGP